MTTVQKQCLLCYLGFYTGEIDGLWGPASEQATIDFQKAYGLEPDGIFGADTEAKILAAVSGNTQPAEQEAPEEPDSFWDDIKHFSREEFRCKCGGKYCDGFPAEPCEKLVRLGERVREHFGAPAVITSGVRCKVHNANVGGVANSRHLRGTAMDFRIKGFSASMVLPYVQAQSEVRYAYAIDSNHIHMDVK